MKQIDKKYLCYWCMGCTAQESENYAPKQRCNGFMPGQADWQERWKEQMKNGDK